MFRILNTLHYDFLYLELEHTCIHLHEDRAFNVPAELLIGCVPNWLMIISELGACKAFAMLAQVKLLANFKFPRSGI